MVSRTGPVDLRLRLYLEALYQALVAPRDQASTVRGALRSLLQFLTSERNSMDVNCQAVSDFLMAENEWDSDWSYLPAVLEELVFDLARTHRVDDDGMPAEDQVCPERLLERLLALPEA